MKLSKTYTSKLDTLFSLLTGAAEQLQKAGELIVELLQENPDTFEEIIKRQPTLDVRFLEALERVGNRRLRPELLLSSAPAALRAVHQALPMSEQKRLLEQPIPVVMPEEGGTRIVNKRLPEIHEPESRRVILDGRIQPPDAQEQLLKQQLQTRVLRETHRWEIRNGKLTLFSDCTFTWAELMELAEKVKPTTDDLEETMKRNTVKLN